MYPRDLSLSLQVLEAGLPLSTPENQLELPGYNFTLSSVQIGEKMRKLYIEEIHLLRQTFLQALARDCVAVGEYERALSHLEESAELHAETQRQVAQDDPTFLLLGEVYEGLGRWEEAQEAYLRAIAQNYSQPEAEAALRRMHQERYGDLEQLHPLLQACHPPAPEFTLKDTLGQDVRLSDFKGKVSLLYYDPVRIEDLDEQRKQIDKRYGVLKAWVGQFQAQGFEVLHVRQYSGHLPSPFRMVLDEDGVADKYGLRDRLGWQPPAMILIDRDGRLRLRRQYDSFEKEAEWDLQFQKKIEEVLQESEPVPLRPVIVSGTQ